MLLCKFLEASRSYPCYPKANLELFGGLFGESRKISVNAPLEIHAVSMTDALNL